VISFKPDYLINIIGKWTKLWFSLSLTLLGVGLYFALWASPPDYLQGENVRIMYVHVPASWGALAAYAAMALMALYGLIKRTPLVFILIQALAPVGLCFCLISLITGSIWGKPTWGTWWVWDARLTSMFILALLYFGYFMISHFNRIEGRGQTTEALLLIIGSLNLPIIKWSVSWWHTLHQPASIMRLAKPAIHNDMLFPLLWMTGAFLVLGLGLSFFRLRTLLLEKRWLHQLLRD
jgi:heme exporter protein C